LTAAVPKAIFRDPSTTETMTEKAPENMSFEAALERLEGIVRKLEAGELSLDDSLSAFEEGVKLSSFCHRRLDEVEKKVQLLLADGTKVPFDPEAADRGKSG